MKKSKRFVKLYKSKRRPLKKGDPVVLFNNKYEVMSDPKDSQVLLKDNKGYMIAMPSDKFEKIRSGISSSMYKSKMDPKAFAKQRVGQMKNPAQPSSPGSGQSKEGFPLYTVRNGRMKVQMNPSKWVDVSEGSSHGAHDAEQSHGHHPDDLDEIHKFKSKILRSAHPEDHDKLVDMVKDWKEKQRKYDNLVAVVRGSRKEGSTTSNLIQNAHKASDKAAQAKTEFLRAYKDSALKQKAGEE